MQQNPDPLDTNAFRYAGQYFDLESGTYYLPARYYNPNTGRFTQQDAWTNANRSDPLGLNLYLYCNGNPVRYWDLNGDTSTLILNAISELYYDEVFSSQAITNILAVTNNFSWTTFHEIAQVNVAKHLSLQGFSVNLEEHVGLKEVDIVANKKYAWEVKPIGVSGKKQLDQYCKEGNYQILDRYIYIDNIPIIDDIKMQVESSSTEKGVLQYSFYRYSDGEKKSVKSTAVYAKLLAVKLFMEITAPVVAAGIIFAGIEIGGAVAGTICLEEIMGLLAGTGLTALP